MINKVWLAIKSAMSKQYLSIIGERMPIRDVPTYMKEVDSYLSDEPAIYIKENPEIAKGLDKPKVNSVYFGLFALEMLRSRYTNYKYADDLAKSEKLTKGETTFFFYMVNILEKAFLETASSTLIGGHLLKSYKFTLKRKHECAEPIENENGFIEYTNALDQYLLMGSLKGDFTSEDAKSLFRDTIKKISPLFSMTDSEKRIDLIYEVFIDSKSLWEKYIPTDDEIEEGKKLNEFFNLISSFASHGTFGDIDDLEPEEIENMIDYSKGASRETTFKKIEEENETVSLEDEDKNEDDEDETISLEDELEDNKLKEVFSHGEGNDESVIEYHENEYVDLSTKNEYVADELEVDRETIEFFDRLIEAEISMANRKEKEEFTAPDFKEIDKKYSGKHYKTSNVKVNLKDDRVAKSEYNKVKRKHLNSVLNVVKQLKKLFAESVEETDYRSSGKLSIPRTMSSTKTAKLFTKTITPEDKSDMAVMVLIDESGSMSGSRIERAKEAAINITEVFGQLGIPTYIMGFTADMHGYSSLHYHYSDWRNLPSDRLKLTSIKAKCNNFDGYAIRYASKVLNLRKETHKILFVISDGQPAAQAYGYWDNEAGYRDTKDAIFESRELGQNVLGVAIGSDIDTLQKMYGKDFIYIDRGADLFQGMMKRFKEMVKKW